jgi:hypothetical protein
MTATLHALGCGSSAGTYYTDDPNREAPKVRPIPYAGAFFGVPLPPRGINANRGTRWPKKDRVSWSLLVVNLSSERRAISFL